VSSNASRAKRNGDLRSPAKRGKRNGTQETGPARRGKRV
ncbi:MAG: hypothetical protein AVDCRST_MAG64-826, partial [uncultured Phycisphaerae bacterium]